MLFWAIHFPCYFITTTISFCSQPQFTPLKKVSLLIKNFLILTCMTSSYQRWCCSSPIVKSHLYIYLFSVFSSVQFSHSVVSNSLQPHELQHARPPYPSPTARVYPNLCPLSRWCHPTILSSMVSPPALNLSQHQGLLKWVSSSHQVAKVLEFQLQHQSFQWTPRIDRL